MAKRAARVRRGGPVTEAAGGRGSRRALRLALPCLALAACVHERDFRAPAGRLLDDTAYTVRAKELRVDAGVIGRRLEDLGANLGLTYGVYERVELKTNIAHAAFAIVNARVKATLVDRPRFALGAKLGFTFAQPKLIWVLPPEYRATFGDIKVIGAPVRVLSTIRTADWLDLHLGLSYSHVDVYGDLPVNTEFSRISLGRRALVFDPMLSFYLGRRVALLLGGSWPLWSALLTDVENKIELQPGIRVGVNSAEWITSRMYSHNSYSTSVELRLGEYTNMRVSMSYRLLGDYFDFELFPAVEFYWRIPLGERRRRRARSTSSASGGRGSAPPPAAAAARP